ncbi:MAG: hypothetical protein ACLSA6_04610 [Holdemania massiliensis]
MSSGAIFLGESNVGNDCFMGSDGLSLSGTKDFACLITAVPALFMTAVSSTYILVASEGFHLPLAWGYPLGLAFTLLCFILFFRYVRTQTGDSN